MNIRPPNGIPVIGQQQATNEAVITQIVQQLSLSIYKPAAIAHIAARDEHQEIEPEHFRQLARDAQTAAQAFFEAQGVKFKKPESPG